jgi:hypothetical protein
MMIWQHGKLNFKLLATFGLIAVGVFGAWLAGDSVAALYYGGGLAEMASPRTSTAAR